MSKRTEVKEDKMTFGEFLKQMFMGQKAISSKRVCGFMGWLVCLFVCVYCTIAAIAAPQIVDMLFICSSSLLGIDSITGIWKKDTRIVNSNKDEEDEGCL